jgi:hypothetical protein
MQRLTKNTAANVGLRELAVRPLFRSSARSLEMGSGSVEQIGHSAHIPLDYRQIGDTRKPTGG